MSLKLYLIADNIRSAHNVGAMLRVAEGLGVSEVFLCGITPYPKLLSGDQRAPYLAEKIQRRIAKTSLGAELTQVWSYQPDIKSLISNLKARNITVVALEQSATSIPLSQFKCNGEVALVVGNEVSGIDPEILNACSQIVEIPMLGQKESFNVSTAAAMALYYLTYGIV